MVRIEIKISIQSHDFIGEGVKAQGVSCPSFSDKLLVGLILECRFQFLQPNVFFSYAYLFFSFH